MSTLEDREGNREGNKVVTTCSKGNSSQLTIADMALGILNIAKTEQLDNNEIKKRIKKTYGRTVSKTILKTTCWRLFTDDKIKKIKKGHFTFYQAKLSQDEYMEMILSKSLQAREWEIPKYHNTKIIFSMKYIQGNKNIDSLPVSLKTLKKPLDPASISQRWNVPSTSKYQEIKGGFQEQFPYNGSEITIQIRYNGGFQIHSQFTQEPKDIRQWLQYAEFLHGLFYARCGYYMEDFQDLLVVMFEATVDTILGRRVSNESSGKYCFTYRQFNTMARVYTKQIGDMDILRREVGNEEPIPYNDFVGEAQAILSGGLNTQALIKMWHDNTNAVKQIAAEQVQQGNAIKFLLLERNKAKRPRKAATKKPKKAKVPGGCFCP